MIDPFGTYTDTTDRTTVEGRLADHIREVGIIKIGKYQLSEHDTLVVINALETIHSLKCIKEVIGYE